MALYILQPHVTEKATHLAHQNVYVFVVSGQATKKEIAKEVESKYGVTAQIVRTIRVHAKRMRLGRIQGVKKGYKKAMVKLKEGEKIEILPT